MSDIKDCFSSRFGKDGAIIQADFSQLEVIGLAYLSSDLVLQDDVKTKDMHCMNTSFFYGESYSFIKARVDAGDPEWIKKRKKVKSFSFLIQYGGGAGAMSAQSGMPKEACQQFIDNFYTMYPDVAKWQAEVAAEVKASRKPTAKRTKGGLPSGRGEYKSITGRVYKFYEYDAPSWIQKRGTLTSFSPTQMKNYPVQGFATGDIVPEVLGRVYRRFKQDKYLAKNSLLINTIHDSILVDSREDAVPRAVQTLKEVMEDGPIWLRERFGIDFNLPLKVDIEVGPHWGCMDTIEL